MMGPVFSVEDEPHLDRLLAAARRAGIDVRPDESDPGRSFWLRRGFGLIHGSTHAGGGSGPAVHLGFGHPFNPILWPADGRLLRAIGDLFEVHGARRLDPNEASS